MDEKEAPAATKGKKNSWVCCKSSLLEQKRNYVPKNARHCCRFYGGHLHLAEARFTGPRSGGHERQPQPIRAGSWKRVEASRALAALAGSRAAASRLPRRGGTAGRLSPPGNRARQRGRHAPHATGSREPTRPAPRAWTRLAAPTAVVQAGAFISSALDTPAADWPSVPTARTSLFPALLLSSLPH